MPATSSLSADRIQQGAETRLPVETHREVAVEAVRKTRRPRTAADAHANDSPLKISQRMGAMSAMRIIEIAFGIQRSDMSGRTQGE